MPFLSREEWDFRARPDPKKSKKRGDWTEGIAFDFLSDDEVWKCWSYEFTRQSSEVEYYMKWREGAAKPEDFDSLLNHYWLTDPNGKTGCSIVGEWFYKIWPEWPAKPFLSVRISERKRRYCQCWGSEPKRRLRLVPIEDLYRFIVALQGGKEANAPKPWFGNFSAEIGADVWTLTQRFQRQCRPPVEIAAFQIDFDLPDKALVRLFRNWLAGQRRDKNYQRHDHRGDSTTKQLRKELRALGAVRLLDLGHSIKQAMDYTEKTSGTPLYRHQGDWSNAKETAKEAIYRAS